MSLFFSEKGDAQLRKNLKTNFYCAALRFEARFAGLFASVRISRICSLFFSFVVVVNLLSPVFAQTSGTSTATAESSNQQSWLKNNRNWIKDIKREIVDIQKDAKNANVTTVNGLVSKYEACLTAREAQLGTDAFSNSTRDCDDIQGLINDELTDNLRPLRDCVSFKRTIDDRRKEKKNNVDAQFKNIKRDDPNADISGLQEIITDMDGAFKTADELLAGQCSEEVRDELNDIQSDLNDNFQDFYDQAGEVSQSVNDQKQLNQNAKDLDKDMKKKCEREITKNVNDLNSDLEKEKKKGKIPETWQTAVDRVKTIHDAICVKAIAAMQDAVKNQDNDAFQDARKDFWDNERDFWDRLNEAKSFMQQQEQTENAMKDIARRKKETNQMRSDYERWLKKNPGKNISDIETALNEIDQIFAEAEKANQEDPNSWWNEYQQELTDPTQTFMDAFQSLQQEENNRQQVSFLVENVKRDVKHAQEVLGNMLKKKEITQEEWNGCNHFAEEVLAKISEADFGSGEDPSVVLGDIDQKAREVCPAYDKIGAAPPPDQAFYKDYFEKNVGFKQDTMNSAADILTRVSQEIVERVFQKMVSDPSMVENLLKVAGNRYKDAAAGTLESVTSFYTDEATQRDLFAKKTQFLELNQQLSDLQSQIQVAKEKLDDLERIQNEIASYNFFGSAGETIRTDIANFIEEAKDKGLSKDEIRAKIDQLTAKKDAAIQESKQAKLEAGIIPFRDADDNEWFTKFAVRVKKKGWIQGTGTSGGMEMNPSGITNVAEAIMMFARVEGIEEGATPISGVGKRLPGWAQAAAGTLDEAGVNLDEIFGGKNPGDSVSRGEVARLLVQVLGLPAADDSEVNVFTDIKLANSDEKAAIAAVNKAGIMTGQGGTGPKVFDVKGPLNRAALVKILDIASRIVQGQ